MKHRHNKRRNTAVLYEILIKQLTKTIIHEQKEQKAEAMAILKEFFGGNSILKKELMLYNTLCERSGEKKEIAEKILQETKKVHFQLPPADIYDAQSKLIKKINKTFPKDTYQNFVPNYKSFASINQIFNKNTAPKKRVLLETEIVDGMSSAEEKKEKALEPLDKLTYKLFINKFNKKYAQNLNEEQKKLLSLYISSFVDEGTEFMVFLNEEVGRLKKEVNDALQTKEIKEDEEMVKKTNSVLSLLEDVNKTPLNEDILKNILKIQKLVEEVNND